jgi:hypothetical protein
MSENEKKCLGPMKCKESDPRIHECCILNGGFHTEPKPGYKGPVLIIEDEMVIPKKR